MFDKIKGVRPSFFFFFFGSSNPLSCFIYSLLLWGCLFLMGDSFFDLSGIHWDARISRVALGGECKKKVTVYFTGVGTWQGGWRQNGGLVSFTITYFAGARDPGGGDGDGGFADISWSTCHHIT